MVYAIRTLCREMLAARTRLILTILAIAWGTATITGMLSVGEGLRTTFGTATSSIGKPFLVVWGGVTSSTQQGQTLNQAVTITEQDIINITRGIPHSKVIPEYNFNANVGYRNQTTSKQINAVYPEYAALRKIAVQPGGRFIDNLDIQTNRRVIVLGTEFVKQLREETNSQSDLLGQFIFIDQKPFQVIGILEKKPTMGFYQMPDNYLAWIPATTYIIDKKPTGISNLLIFPQNEQPIAVLKKQLLRLIARNHSLDPQDENILEILDVRKMQQETHATLTGTELFLGIVGAMTLVVAGVGVANVMFISVSRSTREIGIRMAIGARSWQILWHYIFEALLTTFIGGALGVGLAYALVAAANQIPMNNEVFEFTGKPMPVLSGLVILIVIATLGITGLLAGFFPAWRAANIDPAEALRHE